MPPFRRPHLSHRLVLVASGIVVFRGPPDLCHRRWYERQQEIVMGRRRLDPNPSPDPFGYAVFGLGLGHEEEGTAGKKGTTTILRSPLLPKTLRPVCDRHVKEVVNTLAAKINEEMRFSGLLPHVSHAWKKNFYISASYSRPRPRPPQLCLLDAGRKGGRETEEEEAEKEKAG